jgi:hypothetical protein
MARARTRSPRKQKMRRLTVTMSPELDRYLNALAKANQRSRSWVVNYAIDQIRERYGETPTPMLPIQSSPQPSQANEDQMCEALATRLG